MTMLQPRNKKLERPELGLVPLTTAQLAGRNFAAAAHLKALEGSEGSQGPQASTHFVLST